jgi:hypothetical protein
MNSLTLVIMVIAGSVLVFAAIKGEDPRDLVKKALTQPRTIAPAGRAGSALGL